MTPHDPNPAAGVRGLLLLAAVLLFAPACGDGSDSAASDCAACHGVQAEAWESFSSHKALYGCDFCHQMVTATPGQGHRASTACDHCHSESGHPPGQASGDADPVDICLDCHDPHGSANIYLIRETISIAPGETSAIDFRNTVGRADYGHAELGVADGGENDLEPGSGLCEACHVRTVYYNRTAAAEDHFTDRCTRCHDHAVEFLAVRTHRSDR
ncbi:MAG: hypothetical protein A3J75_03055 [Acidobacteria bacterium RBG_16_68_9]|nr:MAG: hypothetical protein A3J75_03055 [Acidobacteria bacterium RBG_16_68_9]